MRKKLSILFCVLMFLFGTFYVSAQEKEIKLEDKPITIRMDKQPFGDVIGYLIENYDIPIGFEESVLDRNLPDYEFSTNLPAIGVKNMESTDGKVKINVETWRTFKPKKHWITVNVENGKLSEVFDKIVEQMENYKWEISDGVVNIFPVKGRDERFEKLLNLK